MLTSIVALGYISRAEALKNIDRCVTTKPSLKRLLTTASLCPNMTFLTECRAGLRRLAGGFGLSGTSKIKRDLLHNALACRSHLLLLEKCLVLDSSGLYLFLVLSGIQHQQSQGKLAFLHFLRSFGMAP